MCFYERITPHFEESSVPNESMTLTVSNESKIRSIFINMPTQLDDILHMHVTKAMLGFYLGYV